VLAGPREKFTENEINHLKKYLESGGSIMVLLGEGGEKRFNTNINFFLEEYGIMINRLEQAQEPWASSGEGKRGLLPPPLPLAGQNTMFFDFFERK